MIKEKYIVDPENTQYRTDKAFVLEITDITTGDKLDSVKSSFYDLKKLTYICNRKIETDYDNKLHMICSKGIYIYIFKSKERAESYTGAAQVFPENYTGIYHGYDSDGRLKVKANLINGVQWYETFWYDYNGKMIKENFINGKLHGKIYYYNPHSLDGEIITIDNYENNILNESITYQINTNLIVSYYTFKNNFLDGKCFYMLGKNKIEGYYSNNKYVCTKISEDMSYMPTEI
jgi:antitoxin component YwqK of YwqJK toxin-antitoxin module